MREEKKSLTAIIREKEREIRKDVAENMRMRKQRSERDRKEALRIGRMAIAACRRKGIDDPYAHIENLLTGEDANG